MWTLTEAVDWIRANNLMIESHNACVGLTGSVLFKGQSIKDLDVIVFPLKTSKSSPTPFEVCQLFGLNFIADRTMAHMNYKEGDTKTVIHTEDNQGRRIDLFFLQ